MNKFIGTILITLGLSVGTAYSQQDGGTITIPLKEYERLKSLEEVKKEKRYWEMSYQQILSEIRDEKRAWELYRFWNLRFIDFFGTVDYSSVNETIRKINILNEVQPGKSITIVFNSPGGYVYNGLMLYNVMKNSPSPINTVCDTMTASMAAVLFAAGVERTARPGCHFMIHELGGGLQMQGQTTDFLKVAEYAIDLESILFRILSEETGLSMKEIRKLGEYETFYDAYEIVRLGFADKVDPQVTPRFDSDSRDIPEELLPANRIKKNIEDKMTND